MPPDGFVQLPNDGAGKSLRTFDRGSNLHDQYVIPTDPRIVSYLGRAATFRIPGRAGTTGQRIAAIHNATGSTKLVNVRRIIVDLNMTVVKAVTVIPPIIRVQRFTAVPTNGTALAKVSLDTALSSNASITCWQDASADGTSSGTALTITLPANQTVVQEFAPRLITAVGYEPADRIIFLEDTPFLVLRALEGIAVELSYSNAAANPVTDLWTVQFEWEEYSLS
jgi:hypothetical protein